MTDVVDLKAWSEKKEQEKIEAELEGKRFKFFMYEHEDGNLGMFPAGSGNFNLEESCLGFLLSPEDGIGIVMSVDDAEVLAVDILNAAGVVRGVENGMIDYTKSWETSEGSMVDVMERLDESDIPGGEDDK